MSSIQLRIKLEKLDNMDKWIDRGQRTKRLVVLLTVSSGAYSTDEGIEICSGGSHCTKGNGKKKVHRCHVKDLIYVHVWLRNGFVRTVRE